MTLSPMRSAFAEQNVTEDRTIKASTVQRDIPGQTIAITATFTAGPVEESLSYWMRELDIASTIAFAPYNQVFQQLLDPTSLLSHNQKGINVVLIRFEDWQRFEAGAEQGSVSGEKIEQHVHELTQALRAAGRSATPHLLCICPASPQVSADAARKSFFAHMEDRLAADLTAVGGVYVVKSAELLTTYPVSSSYDSYADKLGHVPFTPLFFTALGTLIARKFYALRSAPYKVIALDCDETLWQGICGEDGARGVVIDAHRLQLQEFLIAQQKAGMLLCLCSKNNEQDVFEVFDRHPDMRLKREHLVATRINWQLKSQNLRSLARELQLSLDSFIFIDDNMLECAEVQATCPEVLTLPLPADLRHLPHLLRHFWAFDRPGITAEDTHRTTLYQQQRQRQALEQASVSLKDFLASLNVHVHIAALEESQLSRVSQLTQRTNQFNCTTIRRTESEIQQFCRVGRESKGECLVVEVSDRFGSYGLVGVMLFALRSERLEVDTFLLSCRALGRGIEHQMLSKLGEIAHQRGVGQVRLPYIPTPQNAPACEFLDANVSLPGFSKQLKDDRWIFDIDAASLIGFAYTPPATIKTNYVEEHANQSIATRDSSSVPVTTPAKRIPLLRIAAELSTPEQILRVITAQRRHHSGQQQPFALPRTGIEEQLVETWAEVLNLDQVGIHDDFFASGGNSLLAVQVASRLKTLLHVDVPLRSFFEAPTVARLAETITQMQAMRATTSVPALRAHSREMYRIAMFPVAPDQQAQERHKAYIVPGRIEP